VRQPNAYELSLRLESDKSNRLAFYDTLTNVVQEVQSALAQPYVLHYQPQVDAVGQVVGAEALICWQHPERGQISPAMFIPLAEETRMILPLGQWVLKQKNSVTFWRAPAASRIRDICSVGRYRWRTLSSTCSAKMAAPDPATA